MANPYLEAFENVGFREQEKLRDSIKKILSGFVNPDVKADGFLVRWSCSIPTIDGGAFRISGILRSSLDRGNIGLLSDLSITEMDARKRNLDNIYYNVEETYEAFHRYEAHTPTLLFIKEFKKAVNYLKKNYADKLADNVKMASYR